MYPTGAEGEALDTQAVLQASKQYDACRSLEDVLGGCGFGEDGGIHVLPQPPQVLGAMLQPCHHALFPPTALRVSPPMMQLWSVRQSHPPALRRLPTRARSSSARTAPRCAPPCAWTSTSAGTGWVACSCMGTDPEHCREESLAKPVELERLEKLLGADGGEMQTWIERDHNAFLQVCVCVRVRACV